jgi:hypothetical protein
MSEVNAETSNVAFVVESSQGAYPPPTTGWGNLEADAIGDAGPEYKKQRRNPFTITRQLRRPYVAGLDCAMTLEMDCTKDHLDAFGEAMFKSSFKHSGGTSQSLYRPTAVTATGYTVASNGALANNMLVVARGFGTDANNGLKLLAGTSTATEIKAAGLSAEAAPPANVQVEVAGVQAPSAADVQIDVNGDLISTSLNWTLMGLNVGQVIYIPSAAEALVMGSANYAFANTAYTGFAVVKAIAATKLTLEQRTWTVGAADTAAGKTIRVFFTKWVRNVARSHADELDVSHAFEVTYPKLAAGPADAYEYLLGYKLDQVTFNMAAENRISMQLQFIGKTARNPSTSRATGPSTALDPVTGLAVSTASDIARLSVANVDESGLMTDFQDLKLMIKNNISPEKAIGTLGNRFTPLGVFEVATNAKVYFTDPAMVTAVSDNRVLRMHVGGRNSEFGMVFHVPSTGAMKTDKSFEHNKLITIDTEIAAYMDASRKYTASMSMFAYLPTAA